MAHGEQVGGDRGMDSNNRGQGKGDRSRGRGNKLTTQGKQKGQWQHKGPCRASRRRPGSTANHGGQEGGGRGTDLNNGGLRREVAGAAS